MDRTNLKVEFSNQDKILFEDAGISKGEILEHYEALSDHMLPYLKDRPLMLHRFPDGINENGFYQKEIPDHFPDWFSSKKVKTEDGNIDQILCQDLDSLLYLADQGTISFHAFLSLQDKLKYPDRFVIDLDPPSADFEIVRKAAFTIKDVLDDLEIESFLCTTGSSGLHILIILDREEAFDQSLAFGNQLADYFTDQHQEIFTTASRKKKREGKLYFDVQRNAYAQTSIVPFSLRAREIAPVATPIEWDELKDNSLNSQSYHLKNIQKRLAKKTDPWKAMGQHRYNLKSISKRLKELNE